MIIVWRVTQTCNLSCPFCGFDRRLRRVRRNADVETVARFGAVLSDYQRATGDSVLVSWMGGEPLLWPPLRELTEHFTRRLGVRVSTTTNGTPLASAAVREHIAEHYSELTVSVDGLGAVHDDLRGWRGGFAHLRRVIPMLVAERQTRGRGPLLRVNVVLMRDTISGFERLSSELADWGIDEITFNQLGGDDRRSSSRPIGCCRVRRSGYRSTFRAFGGTSRRLALGSVAPRSTCDGFSRLRAVSEFRWLIAGRANGFSSSMRRRAWRPAASAPVTTGFRSLKSIAGRSFSGCRNVTRLCERRRGRAAAMTVIAPMFSRSSRSSH